MRVLVVHQPFGDYAKGDMIKDPEVHADLAKRGQAHHCTVTDVDDSFFADDAPEPAKSKAAKPKASA